MIRRIPAVNHMRALAYLCTIILTVAINFGWPLESLAEQPVQQTLTAASSNNFPPINYLDDEGRLTGFGRELAEAVVKAAGGEVRHIHSPTWTEVLDWLASGEADFIHDTGYTPDRASFLDFSEPILSMPEEIFVLSDHFDIQSIDSLSGKRVACVDRHITHLYLMKIPEIKCQIVKTPLEGLEALLSREVDAFIYPRQIVLYNAHKRGVIEQIKKVGEPVRNLNWHMAVKKGNADVLVLLNRGITRVKATGEYQRIYDKWFGEIVFKGYSSRDIIVIVVISGSFLFVVVIGFLVWTWVLRRKVAQKAAEIKESEQRFRKYFEIGPVGIAETSPEKGWVRINDNICDMLGYTREELSEKTWAELTYPDDLEADNKQFERVLAGEIDSYSLEKRFVRKDGSIVPTILSVNCERADDGSVDYFVAILQDITRSNALEEQLRQSQKMEAIGQLAGGIAHDYNNMLGVIIGNIQMVEGAADLDDKSRQRLDKALAAAQRNADLTAKLLGFSRPQAGETQLTAPNDFIENLKEIIATSLTSSIRVEFDLANNLWPVDIDPGEFEDMLLNLAINARDAMPGGGVLAIGTANKAFDDDDTKHHPGSHAGEYVMISVSDTGIGMSQEISEQIFDPFFSTKETGKGTGLGLSMVYAFVQRSGGFIMVHSDPGEGTSFGVFLPRAREGVTGEVIAAAIADHQPPCGIESVLVVDDEEFLVDLAVTQLENLGYQTLSAGNGEEALDILKANPNIDLLFSDITMPGKLDGYDLALAAMQLRPSLKVLLASGFAKERDSASGDDEAPLTKLTASRLNKPYTLTELGSAVRRSLDEAG